MALDSEGRRDPVVSNSLFTVKMRKQRLRTRSHGFCQLKFRTVDFSLVLFPLPMVASPVGTFENVGFVVFCRVCSE